MMLPRTGPPRPWVGTAACFRYPSSSKRAGWDTPARFSVCFERRSSASSYPKRRRCGLASSGFPRRAPDYIVPLIKAMEGGADVVAGVVEVNGRPTPRAVCVARRMAPWVLGRAFGGAPVSDPLSGFRAYRLIVLKKAVGGVQGQTVLDDRFLGVQRRTTGSGRAPRAPDRRGPVTMRYDVHRRPSRLRAVRTLRGLLRVRRERWERPVREGKQ